MALAELIQHYRQHPSCSHLASLLKTNNNRKILCSGLTGSSKSLLTAAIIPQLAGIHLIMMPDKEDSAYFYNDLVNLLDSEHVLFFPSSFRRSVHYNQPDNGNIILRTNVINRLGTFNSAKDDYLVLVTYPEGLSEKVITHKKLKKNTLQLIKGEKIPVSFVGEVMEEYRFTQVDFVYEPGQYSIRGSIFDIFSFSSPDPYRIDFFGDEVETIRTFDVETQLSKGFLEKINILPNIQELTLEDVSEPLTDYLDSSAILWIQDIRYSTDKLNDIFEAISHRADKGEEIVFLSGGQLTTGRYLLGRIPDFRLIEFGARGFYPDSAVITFNTTPQPAFNKNFNLLAEDLLALNAGGYKNLHYQ